MTERFNVSKASPKGYQAMLDLGGAAKAANLSPALLELVKIRISQINGCAFCIDMHVKLARQHGISDDRLHLLPAWREAPAHFDARERAALAWGEALTVLDHGAGIDQAYQEALGHFSVEEIAGLAFAIVQINGWNRLMIAAGTPPPGGAKSA